MQSDPNKLLSSNFSNWKCMDIAGNNEFSKSLHCLLVYAVNYGRSSIKSRSFHHDKLHTSF
jgi:hypothetical protein